MSKDLALYLSPQPFVPLHFSRMPVSQPARSASTLGRKRLDNGNVEYLCASTHFGSSDDRFDAELETVSNTYRSRIGWALYPSLIIDGK